MQNTKLLLPRNLFDAERKAAEKTKNRVYRSIASDCEQQVAVQCFHAVIDRVKKAWLDPTADPQLVFGGHPRLGSTTSAMWNWQPNVTLAEACCGPSLLRHLSKHIC